MTEGVSAYLLVALVVFGVNLLPAFGPPTWALLVLFRLNSHVPAVPLVLIGALSAAAGRLVLAEGSRRLRSRISATRRDNLAVARDVLSGGRTRGAAALALFALSPVPSAQLFVAAGLLDVALVPLTAVFFAGRLVSYSVYVSATGLAGRDVADVVRRSLTSPVGIALQVLMLAGLVALVRVDWVAILRRAHHRRDA